MRHAVYGRKLSRTKNERRRLLQGLARELIRRGSVRTTYARARAVQPLMEKLVTSAKQGGAGGATIAIKRVVSDKETEKLLLADAGTRFAARTSGFTRVIKLGPRRGDAAEEVMLQFVDERVAVEVVKPPEKVTKADGKVKEKEVVGKKKPGRRRKITSVS